MINYVLVTPAKNEESNIAKTIESLLAQTHKPTKWIIVDDASTDRTSDVVRTYLPICKFITLLRRETSGERNFRSKVGAFNAGLNLLKDTAYSFVGNLDGDVSFAPNYFATIIAEFQKDPKLGIAGGIVYTRIGRRFDTSDRALDSVGGAVQLFRRECFEQVGGYIPLEHGGIDAAAEIMARMNGWSVKKFPENRVWEHRRTGSAGNCLLASMYKLGVRFHTLGYSTTFFALRSIYKVKARPYLIGSAVTFIGFLSARIRGLPMSLPPEAIFYLRSEQMKKLRNWLSGRTSKNNCAEISVTTNNTSFGG